MSVKPFRRFAALATVTGLGTSVASAQITIPTVPVGNPGNETDPGTGSLYGSVARPYRIAETEVTNGEYAEFLNAVARADPNGLYNTNMGGSAGGIARSGPSGDYSYTTINGKAEHPVNYVSFWDACRFANWLHNDQPRGAQDNSTTEDGAYTLTVAGMSQNTVTRNPAARWAVPSEDEWYKAAYHQPFDQGGSILSYWFYPTSSGVINTSQANYGGVIGDTSHVGSYAPNFYGTFDMAGNVWEWNDTIVSTASGPVRRGLRGGSRLSLEGDLQSAARGSLGPLSDGPVWGFRVADVHGCAADLTGSFDPNDPTYGEPDGTLDAADFFYYLDQFVAGDLEEADLSGSSDPNDPAYGVPDGTLDASDFFYYLDLFVQGCD